ncbi:protein-methionine-sulfoxide reductase catalytic subunit MsrP [Pikeienuella piscinae]|uniref:Protein-methionine-sulfoxide reductase catalytic subunit MsrP n=1 Tax=Pikeienuella piscinae TaxID=2748098 RepID=A0A7M3T6P2_9RHOB|nr:protein-methionine-sulfoxide reductase catalytic subunit MsrP [Pikeienuella piscinae]QIE57673.1 protein-methionine-sulfoxide reductase catalytic subunit MsrP [Pikeienuella piscinae]
MRLIRRPEWSLPESAATSESAYLNRRALLAAMGFGAVSAIAPRARAATSYEGAPVNPDFREAGRPVTPESLTGQYNNFYEFGSHKQIAAAAQSLKTDGWTITIDGLVETEMTVSTDDLVKLGLEERVYRHRCVEAWSMVAPWIGVPLEKVVKMAAPLSGAKYVRFETFLDPQTARGQRQSWYPWPYVDAITIAEATNPLPMLVMGAYGKVLANQFGAPARLHLPWKYGFKSVKSITRISFVEERPVGFWEELQYSEYGFWANVNPEVSHPRWSQADERDLESGERIPTQIFNGYGATVASLYENDPEAQAAGDRLWR